MIQSLILRFVRGLGATILAQFGLNVALTGSVNSILANAGNEILIAILAGVVLALDKYIRVLRGEKQ